jgi:hypothetical protein
MKTHFPWIDSFPELVVLGKDKAGNDRTMRCLLTLARNPVCTRCVYWDLVNQRPFPGLFGGRLCAYPRRLKDPEKWLPRLFTDNQKPDVIQILSPTSDGTVDELCQLFADGKTIEEGSIAEQMGDLIVDVDDATSGEVISESPSRILFRVVVPAIAAMLADPDLTEALISDTRSD